MIGKANEDRTGCAGWLGHGHTVPAATPATFQMRSALPIKWATPPDPVGRWPGVRTQLAAALLLLPLAGCAGQAAKPAAAPPPLTATPAPSPTKAPALVACEKDVLEQLKAPATAVFSGEKPAQYGNAMPKEWVQPPPSWEGKVDSQNGFGALIRGRFLCNKDGGGSVYGS